jgi:S1-C subfamily serine protease
LAPPVPGTERLVDLPDVLDLVRPAVTQITCTIQGLTAVELQALGVPGDAFFSRPIGSGFLVNDQAYVVTAQHVLDGARTIQADFSHAHVHIGVGLAYANQSRLRSQFNVTTFDVIEEDAQNDVALVRMRRNPFLGECQGLIELDGIVQVPLHGAVSIETARPHDGEQIAISGYPLRETSMTTTHGIVASSWAHIIDREQDPTTGAWAKTVRDVYLADVQTNPGNSGGPAYRTSDGAVIGVLVAGRLTEVVADDGPAVVDGVALTADAGLSVLVPATYVVDLLDRNHVNWTPAA